MYADTLEAVQATPLDRAAPGDQAPAARAADEDLAHRFRHATRAGQVSPLFHLVLRHKQETGSCMPAI